MNRKLFLSILIVCAVAISATALLIISSVTETGAETPVNAVWGYEKSAMLNDASGMMKFSSEYNKRTLNDANPSEKGIEEYLGDLYEATGSIYENCVLECKTVSSEIYENGSEEYSVYMSEYLNRVENASAEAFASVKINIYKDDTKILSYPALAVKISGRWFFFKTNY